MFSPPQNPSTKKKKEFHNLFSFFLFFLWVNHKGIEERLRDLMRENGIDAYVIPSADAHQVTIYFTSFPLLTGLILL